MRKAITLFYNLLLSAKKTLAVLTVVTIFTIPAGAQTIYALSGNELISFNALLPNVIINTVSISGIGAGQSVEGMDYFRMEAMKESVL